MRTDASTASRRPQDRKAGYVLLAVLGVLILMITVLASLSQLSLRRALAAADATVRLQQRAGIESIEAAVLPRAAAVFDQLEATASETAIQTGSFPGVPHQIRTAVTIGGVTFDVVLADEDAKLNLNQVYHSTGLARTQRSLEQVLGPSASRAVRLKPATRPVDQDSVFSTVSESEDEPEAPRAFRTWGEVFDLQQLRRIAGSDAALPNLTGDLTCWGAGALNIVRASDTSLKAAAACVLSDAGAGRLVRRYREKPNVTLELLIAQETNSETERRRLRRMLSTTSTHFSVWVDASTTTRRSSRVFSVLRMTDEGITVNERFAY